MSLNNTNISFNDVPMKEVSYKSSIIREVYFAGNISCMELSKKMNKSLSLTSKFLNEMIEDQIVEENGYALSSGGRRPLMYRLRKDLMYIVSVAMDQLITRIVIMDMHNNFVTPVTKVELPLTNNYVALQTLTEAIVKVIKDSEIDKDRIAGIGIGMPGFVDPQAGHNYTFLGANISKQIKISTGIPVFIENDSSSIALAEYYFGSATDNSMIINFNWGVGLGIIINGELYRGANGFAGEFSHIPMFKNGKLCSCGKIGCLETESSFIYMINTAEERIKEGKQSSMAGRLTADKNYEEKSRLFADAVTNGDSLAIELVSEVGYNIGSGIAILIHLFNPGKIILSGRGALMGNIWLTPMQQALNEMCIPKLARFTEISVSKMGYESELIGAAILVMSNVEEIYQEARQKEKLRKMIGRETKITD